MPQGLGGQQEAAIYWYGFMIDPVLFALGIFSGLCFGVAIGMAIKGRTTMNNKDSLRAQIISAMNDYYRGKRFCSNEELFDLAIMPVLSAAMTAGELLLHRATTPPKPVNDALIEWLEGCCKVVGSIQMDESIISRKQALNTLYQLESSAQQALVEAKGLRNHLQDLGNLQAGKPFPAKG